MRDRLIDSVRVRGSRACALILPIFVLAEVNYPRLAPQSQLAVFATLGLVLLFLASRREEPSVGGLGGLAALAAAGLSLVVGIFLVVQTEPLFERWWIDGRSLGERAGIETVPDIAIGVIGLALVLVAAWRSVGLALPILAGVFLVYGYLGDLLPNWLLPHRGYDIERLVGQTFLHSQGVFGVALKVMFTYVFLFVVFGALLEATGATEFIIEASRRRFRASPGGPAKVAVISSGLMGSLSGSAVANTASTGTFTIPMMKSAGFAPRVAAGLEAAASSGGALVPPVMGAGAYMMLEIIDPPVSYLQIIRAALIPALLYYLSLYLFVHFHGRSVRASSRTESEGVSIEIVPWQGAVFVGGLAVLIVLLVSGYTVFRAVSVAMVVVVLLGMAHERTRIDLRKLTTALKKASANGVSLIAAASCVGIVIGVVTLTGVGTRLPSLILPLAEGHLTLALMAIMISSIVLGMGLPSAVCYLLMATLIGPVLGNLGVVPLAAHLFIFYFGMMSMVTPPVALAGYAASSIAGSKLIETSTSAFRFALVGFVLPYLFVFKPELLMLAPDGGAAPIGAIIAATLLAATGVLALAVSLAGFVRRPLAVWVRAGFLLAAVLLLIPGGRELGWHLSVANLLGAALLIGLYIGQVRRRGEQSVGTA